MTSDLPPPDPEGIHPVDDEAYTPNYTARRVAVAAGAIGVIALAVFAITRLVGGGDDGDDVTAPGWDALVEVDRSSGDVRVLDRDGEELTVIDGSGRATDVHVRGDRVAIVGPGAVTLTSLTGRAPEGPAPTDDDTDTDSDSGDDTGDDTGGAGDDGLSSGSDAGGTLVVDVPVDATVTRVPTNRSLSLVAAPSAGGNVVVVDGSTGALLDIGAIAGESSPLFLPDTLRSDPDGDRFAVGDGRNFQTVVASFGDDEATFYPGVPVALDDGLVVTSLIVGRNAELRLFDPGSDATSVVATQRPVGGVVDGRRVVFATEDGRVLAATLARGDADELVDLELDRVDWALAALDGERLVVAGGDRVVVVGLDGEIVADASGASTVRPWATWRCLPVIGGDLGIVDLRDGSVVAEVDSGDIGAVSVDGCGAHVTGDGTSTVASPSGTVELDASVRAVVLAPDGSAVLVTSAGGATELIDVGDRRRLDIGVRRGLLAFAQR